MFKRKYRYLKERETERNGRTNIVVKEEEEEETNV
jgi:hypothetical protein